MIRKIANRQLFAEIKRTPFGATYRAIDEKSRQLVLVKTFQRHGDAAGSAAAESRFEREAQIYAAISHPNIVRLLEFGIDDDLKYLVLEYVDGLTFRQLLKSTGAAQPLPPQVAVVLFRDLLRGLDELHRNNVIHHDLKPENILISHDGIVKICDFDLALSGEKSHSSGLTGTPGYLAPEVILGEPVSAAADLFSAGILLYEMLTGTRPFETGTASGEMKATVQMPHLPASKMNEAIPALFDELIANLLEKKPVNRMQSGREIVDWLRQRVTAETLENGKAVIKRYIDEPATFQEDDFQQFLRTKPRETAHPHKNWWRIAIPVVATALVFFAAIWFAQSDWPSSARDGASLPRENLAANDSMAVERTTFAQEETARSKQPASMPAPNHGDKGAGDSGLASSQSAADPQEDEAAKEVATAPMRREIILQTQPWAYVFIDGDSLGPTPFAQPLVLSHGEHDLRLKKPRFPGLAFTLIVDATTPDTLTYRLWEHVALLEIRITPWADFSINGAARTFPDGTNQLIFLPGKYDMQFRHPELGEKSETLFLQAGERRTLSVNMFTKN